MCISICKSKWIGEYQEYILSFKIHLKKPFKNISTSQDFLKKFSNIWIYIKIQITLVGHNLIFTLNFKHLSYANNRYNILHNIYFVAFSRNVFEVKCIFMIFKSLKIQCFLGVWRSTESKCREKEDFALGNSRSRRVSSGARSIRLTTGLSRFQDVEDRLTCTLFRPWEEAWRRRPGRV